MAVAVSVPLVIFDRRLAYWIQVLGARYRRYFLLETLEQRDDARPLSDSLYPGFPISR
jgi:hypothetical protein